MKLVRTFILLLLCVVLPINGVAASGLLGNCVTDVPMSMEQSPSMSADMSDCDSMKSQSSPVNTHDGGMLCKLSAQCQLGTLYPPAFQPSLIHPVVLSGPTLFPYAHSLSSLSPDGLWRPPRLV